MNVIDHGRWLPHTPEIIPEGAPPNALFARREADSFDWYDYVNSGDNFAADTVKLAAIWREDASGYVVGPAVYDATLLFPAGHIVFEITGYIGSNPQADFGNKVYDPATKTFSDQPPRPPMPPSPTETRILGALDAITDRLEKLERR